MVVSVRYEQPATAAALVACGSEPDRNNNVTYGSTTNGNGSAAAAKVGRPAARSNRTRQVRSVGVR